MAYEIIYVCNSTNNKNVRDGELNILRKKEDSLFFEFGFDEMNIKKRFYNDIETLEKDFNALLELKNKKMNEIKKEIKEEIKEEENKMLKLVEETNEKIDIVYKKPKEMVEKETKEETEKNIKKVQKEDKLDKYKIIKRKK